MYTDSFNNNIMVTKRSPDVARIADRTGCQWL